MYTTPIFNFLEIFTRERNRWIGSKDGVVPSFRNYLPVKNNLELYREIVKRAQDRGLIR